MSTQPTQSDPRTVLVYGRLSYPNLFEASRATDAKGQPTGDPKFSAVILIDKVSGAAHIEALKAAANFTKNEKWQGKTVNLVRSCLRDGSVKAATDGYGDKVMFISASNKKRPHVVGRKLEPLTAEDGKVYAGCYVNAEVQCWAQDNGYGKALNWSLQKVQFVKDGEPFGEKQTPVESVFKPLEGDDDNSQVDAKSTAAANADI